MSNYKINVLESINSIIYKNEVLSFEKAEEFFNRRKRAMIFIINNETIDKIIPKNYGVLEIHYKNGDIKETYGKIVSLEKEINGDEYLVGISIDNEDNIYKYDLTLREVSEACLFLKMLYKTEAVFPDLKVLIDNNDNELLVPYMNEDEEVLYYQYMTREQALGIEDKKVFFS